MLTLAAVADHKGISLDTLDVQIDQQTDACLPRRTTFVVQIDLGSSLPRRERIILYNSARHCEVYQLLSSEIAFEYQLVER